MPVSNKTKSQGASFRSWFSEANTILGEILGLSALDMEDYLWRDDFESDLTPKEGIEGALEYWEEDLMFSRIAEDLRNKLEAYEPDPGPKAEPKPEPEEYYWLGFDPNTKIVHWLRDNRPLCGAEPGDNWSSLKWTRSYFLEPKIGEDYYPSCSNCQRMIREEAE